MVRVAASHPIAAIARWLLWALVLCLPLAIWPGIRSVLSPHVMVKFVIMGVAGSAILLLAGLALVIDRHSAERARGWIASPPAWGFAALGMVIIAATVASPVADYAWFEAWIVLIPLALGAACGWLFHLREHARRTAWMMVAAGFLVALLGLLDAAGIVPLLEWTTGGRTMEDLLGEYGASVQGGAARGRLLSTLGNPAYVGGFLVIPTVILGCWLIAGWERERPSWKRAAAGWVALGVMAVALVATSTREAWLGIVVGVAARLWLADRTPRRDSEDEGRAGWMGLPRQGWLALGAMAAGLLLLLVVFSTPNPVNRRGWNVAGRFVELADPRSDSIRERLMFYTLASRMASQRPWLGWGPGMFGIRFYPTIEQFLDEGPHGPWAMRIESLRGRVADNAHNDFLQMTVECGVLGLAAMVWLFASVLVLGSTRSRRPGLMVQPDNAGTVRVLACAWVACLATLLTSFPLHTPARALFFWVLTGTLASLLVARTPAPEKASEKAAVT